jgi:hypothetical protein
LFIPGQGWVSPSTRPILKGPLALYIHMVADQRLLHIYILVS